MPLDERPGWDGLGYALYRTPGGNHTVPFAAGWNTRWVRQRWIGVAFVCAWIGTCGDRIDRAHGTELLAGVARVGIPGEMTASLGLEIKDNARQLTGVKHPVIGGLADAWISYILPAAEYRRGGYEASVSFYGESLGDAILTGALRGVEACHRHMNRP